MHAHIAKLWIKALRSGKYKQAYSTLRQGRNFCCLGVLCNLHAQAHPEIAKYETDKETYLGHHATLPPEVRDWAGMATRDGILPTRPGVRHSLVRMNDVLHADFSAIADAIERYRLVL